MQFDCSLGGRPNSFRAHGVVVSHPLRMRKALGSNPSVSIVMQDVAVPPPMLLLPETLLLVVTAFY